MAQGDKQTTKNILTRIRNWTNKELFSRDAALINISSKIPSAATVDNKLVDTATMNSSIATATATFRGSYNAVSDLGLQTLPSNPLQLRLAISMALASYLSTLVPPVVADNNDYVFVQVPTAVLTPEKIASVDRYKYDGSYWAFEFSLNNSTFTAAQWAAINSGITESTWALTPEAILDNESQEDFADAYQQALAQVYQAIIDAQNAKADYVGDDFYVYHWDATQGKYVKTNKYVKGADGQPGTTDYNQLSNKPNLATVATSGSYEDLSNKPTIPNCETVVVPEGGTWPF